MRSRGLFIVGAILCVLLIPHLAARGEATIDFDRDVRPILSDKCFFCHGPDRAHRKADLRLDTHEGALAKLKDGYAIVPGKPDASELVRRINTTDRDDLMPPPDSGRTLTDAQKKTLTQWITQGAAWAEHWSFVPPVHHEPPAVKRADWARNLIDRFALAKMEEAGVAPSPEADKRTLIRRVTMDLTGLPPTRDEVAAFLADDSPQAYDKLVDRLLASPAYGEHMAWTWLDEARYADSNGYQQDATRTMWPWRDWVVKAFNENMPFDQFTVKQIAGDLLPNATLEDRLATGFNRNHMLNGEGGRIPEESRVDYVVDRVDTTATVWLGLTLGCARCHDHKYDPFTQVEFYQLYAYFNNIDESGAVDAGGNARPVMSIPTPQQQEKQAALQKDLAAAQQRLDAALADKTAPPQTWIDQQIEAIKSIEGDAKWAVLHPTSATSKNGQTMHIEPDDSVYVNGVNLEKDVYTLTLATDAKNIRTLRLEALPREEFTHHGLARSDSGNFVLTEIEISEGGKPVKITGGQADFEQSGFPVASAFDGKSETGWAVNSPKINTPRTAQFALGRTIVGGPGTTLTLVLKHESPHKHHNIGLFRLSVSSKPIGQPSVELPAAVKDTLLAAERTADQTAALTKYYHDLRAQPVKDEIDAIHKKIEAAERSSISVMVMAERKEPREAHVLIRGAYDKYGEPVHPGVPARLNALPKDAPSNRLALAKWLVDPANPLTARVTINHYWQQFFGMGLVKTTEDFGSQGERPSHPELLDELAVQFVESGWNVKAMHRMIVTSATYRQSSRVTEAMVERDPENRLLTHGPRYRWPSQVLRDQALSLGGLLNAQMGGPGVRAYQPPGLWEDFSFGKIRYEQDHGAALYRRSLYLFWRRTIAPTTLFDTSSRQVCMVRQRLTNTPLHALTLLNDPAYVEAGRAVGERMMHEGGPTAKARMAWGFELVTGRAPTAEEASVLYEGFERTLAQYRADPTAAEQLLSIGESKPDAKLDPVELATYTTMGNTLLNLDEVINKE
ncbi:MAG: DUF1549 domain-containing protein [Planctomycetes bacterium]|nr:DUF1549 domain-containing protein [Planctomycetota bacterium]